MLRFLTAPAACLILCGAAAAQDMPGLASLGPPDLGQLSDRVPELKVETGHPEADPPVAHVLGTSERPPGDGAPRGAEPGRSQAVADLKSAPGSAPGPAPGPAKPWCAQERRIGTGAGFCMMN
ncbi:MULTISPECIES: hypothetical protein [unclassified Methylobacterium]|uniref:hypothetical protein n=1 Tax=unclassified Methylobacterium TaxID=2615210 RepID=UPI001FB89D56|nr:MULTISPECIES: hypothetical protein [unclassified Methylobacterium]MCJ2022475.1 hypothetical protein [Methylobacterium sp. E-065]